MIPIKDTILRRTYPYATLLIIIVNLLVFALELSLPPRIRNDFIYVFGLVPARYSHHRWAYFLGVHLDAYWPFITNLFLHGGWLHIIGNMWFLYLFGDNVEPFVALGLMLGFGEAFLTGALVTLFVVYRHEWVCTFDDSRYLARR